MADLADADNTPLPTLPITITLPHPMCEILHALLDSII